MKFLMLSNTTKPDAEEFSKRLAEKLVAEGHMVMYTETLGESIPDVAILSGGDGTMLRNVPLLKKLKIPVLGVNFGKFGCLALCEPENVDAWLEEIMAGTCSVERRTLFAGEILAANNKQTQFSGLNEIVIHRGLLKRPLTFLIYINDELIEKFWADGVIVSTPTGSTAYNFSAGGPILMPESRNLVITPICARGLLHGSIVVAGTDIVNIVFERPKDSEHGETPTLIVDGREKYPLAWDNKIVVGESAETLDIYNAEGSVSLRHLRGKLAKAVYR